MAQGSVQTGVDCCSDDCLLVVSSQGSHPAGAVPCVTRPIRPSSAGTVAVIREAPPSSWELATLVTTVLREEGCCSTARTLPRARAVIPLSSVLPATWFELYARRSRVPGRRCQGRAVAAEAAVARPVRLRRAHASRSCDPLSPRNGWAPDRALARGGLQAATEYNTCVFKLEVKNPSNPADVPDPLPKGTKYAPGPRRTMNVFR